MNYTAMQAATWVSYAVTQPIGTINRLWARLTEDDGLDEAPSKMIYLAVGVALAIAATVFIIAKFNDAQGQVPDPVAPNP